MTECVVCDGLGCEFCPKVISPEEDTFPLEALTAVFLWDIAFWLALVVLIGWLT